MTKKNASPYERGKRWGFAIFKSNLELFGKRGLDKSDAAARTCGRYARDTSIKRTKSGKYLRLQRAMSPQNNTNTKVTPLANGFDAEIVFCRPKAYNDIRRVAAKGDLCANTEATPNRPARSGANTARFWQALCRKSRQGQGRNILVARRDGRTVFRGQGWDLPVLLW